MMDLLVLYVKSTSTNVDQTRARMEERVVSRSLICTSVSVRRTSRDLSACRPSIRVSVIRARTALLVFLIRSPLDIHVHVYRVLYRRF